MARQYDRFEAQYYEKGGKCIAKLGYRDAEGKVCRIQKTFDNKNEAKDRAHELTEEVEKLRLQTGRAAIKKTDKFSKAIELAKRTIYAPATIDSDGYKESGVRAYKATYASLDALQAFFGDRTLETIKADDVHAYRHWRVNAGSRTHKQKSVRPIQAQTAVLDLKRMKRIWNWLRVEKDVPLPDVFAKAKTALHARQRSRKRALTTDEQNRLLAACRASKCLYLSAYVLIAMDGGLRREEVAKLRWRDLSFERQTVRILGTHTKTETERTALLSSRAIAELSRLENFQTRTPDGLIFGNYPRRQFENARDAAKLADIHFHDLRATAITVWQQRGLTEGLAGQLAGHADTRTTAKFYTSGTEEVASDAAAMLDAYHNEQVQEVETTQ